MQNRFITQVDNEFIQAVQTLPDGTPPSIAKVCPSGVVKFLYINLEHIFENALSIDSEIGNIPRVIANAILTTTGERRLSNFDASFSHSCGLISRFSISLSQPP